MKFFYIFIILICLSSCENIFIIDDKVTEPKLVISCILQADSTAKVFVKKSNNLFDPILDKTDTIGNIIFSSNDLVKNAIVKLNSEILEVNKDGIYVSHNKLIVQQQYNLEVSCDGYKTVTSSEIIPQKVEITKIEFGGFVDIDADENEWYGANIVFNDIPNQENYYMIMMKTGVLFENGDYELNYELLKSNLPNIYGSGRLFFSDEMFTNQEINLYVKIPNEKPNIATVELYSISEQFYNYLYSLDKIYTSKSSFSIESGFTGQTTPVTMFTNIENGYGIFAGYSMDRDSIFGIPYPEKKKKNIGIFHKYLKVVYIFLRSLRFFFCVTLREIYNQTFHAKSRKEETQRNAQRSVN